MKKLMLCFLIAWALPAAWAFGVEFTLGYFGETGSHPGIGVSIGEPVVTAGGYSLEFRVRLAWYVHARNHDGFIVNVGVANRFDFGGGFYALANLETGWFARHPNAPVYGRTASGGVDRFAPTLESRFNLLASAGFGWRSGTLGGTGGDRADDSAGTGGDRARFFPDADSGAGDGARVFSLGPLVEFGVFGEYPFNGYVLPHPFVQVSVSLE